MPLSLPSLSDEQQQIATGFAARLPGNDVTLRVGFVPVLSKLLAGGIWSAFRALGFLARQLFIGSAEAPYLDRRLADYALSRIPAVAATGFVTFSGSDVTAVGAGAVLLSSDGTQSYTTNGPVVTGTIGVTAVTPGSAANQITGAPLTLASAIAGVNPQAIVQSPGITGGLDTESDASFRARGLARIQQPPQGGAGADFWQWARNSGIPTRAWVYPLNAGPGTCDITFVIDTRPNPIPLSADIAGVQAAIDAVAPVIGIYTVYASIADALAVTIHGMVPNDSATQAAVTAALVALAATVPPGGAGYGDGVTVALQGTALFPKQVPGKLYLSMIEAAIDSVGTIQAYDLVAPAADVVFAAGHLPAVPSVTFT